MKRSGRLFLLAGSWVGLVSSGFSQLKVTAVPHRDRVDILIDKNLFTSYHFSQEEKYPFFFPVNGPSQAGVTSMRNGNYPHHSSLFFGCDKVNGGNFWQEGLDRGQILSFRTDLIPSGEYQVMLENECIWRRPGAGPPIRDIRRIQITAPASDRFLIDFNITLEMLEDVVIERTNHSLFSARMDPDLSVTFGGSLVNAEGASGEKATFGLRSPWMDFSGPRGKQTEGLAILQHPSNVGFPAPWFTRDYGFFSPTPMYWPADETRGTIFRKGDSLVLRYRVVVHGGDAKVAGIARLFEEYARE